MDYRRNISDQPKVFIVVLTWNNFQDTVECLESIKKISYKNFDIIVVDNGSSDGSASELERRFSDIMLIKNEENFGYAVGNNIGIKKALKMGGDYVFLLNNDTTIEPGCLQELVQNAESDSSIGAVGPKILLYNDPAIVWFAGGEILFREAISVNRGFLKKDRPSFCTVKEVSFISGCAMLLKKSVLQEVGLFDPRYVSYMEDTDLCWRMNRRGFKLLYVPNARVFHKVSQSFGTIPYNEKTMYLMGRNAVLFMKKYGTLFRWCKFTFFFWLSVFYAFPREFFRDNHKAVFAKIKGFLDGIQEEKKANELR